MPSCWVVGAMYGGADDQLPKFIRRGYWKLGWADQDKPQMAGLRDQIEPGDRIAVKPMMGRGSPNIRITTLGIVTEVDSGDGRVYTRWAANALDRIVERRGCFAQVMAHSQKMTTE